MKKGRRVIAILSIEDNNASIIGEGTYQGELVPDIDRFSEHGTKNPCILLDDGKYVWGFQCWWGSVEGFNEHYGDKVVKQFIDFPFTEIKPFVEPEPPDEL